MPRIDFLIIGSGIAGLSLAIKVARQFPDRKVHLITKDDELSSNTRYAQGGIAAVINTLNDSFEKHIADTLKAGDGLCDKRVVEAVVQEAPQVLNDLIISGVEFDRDDNGELAYRTEGGHSAARIAHFQDTTGFQIVKTLLMRARSLANIVILAHHIAIDLITSERNLNAESRCIGAFILNKKTNVVEKYFSKFVIAATGGIGRLYKVSTNPSVATGDGIALAHRAGADVKNMEFVQFHPTALALKGMRPTHFLITEALRGFGAHIKNHLGERFMRRYDQFGELSCRDVVARAIENEMYLTGRPHVYLDCTHLPSSELIKQFPNIYHNCLESGVDITKHQIPVIPAAHYLCGGISVDLNSESSLPGFYALGECSYTGLHGANRLASNSLLEAAVFAEFCFRDIKRKLQSSSMLPDEATISSPYSPIAEGSLLAKLLIEQVQHLMTTHAGIIRTNKGLNFAMNYLEKLSDRMEQFYSSDTSTELIELKNIILCSSLIVQQSLERKSNCGVFYNKDLICSSVEVIN